MVVVMAIIAIISTFGISAFLNTRDQALVSDAAEKYLSILREAQNRSVSITKGKDTNNRAGTDTIVWGVKNDIVTKTFSLVYFDMAENSIRDASEYTQETPVLDSPITISSSYINGLGGPNSPDTSLRYILYSSPFAKTSTATDPCNTVDCYWMQSSSPARDWVMSAGNGFTNTSDYIRTVFSYKGHSQSIVIRANGDSYLE
jgi:type II secretory pathway pseudopilin PulG